MSGTGQKRRFSFSTSSDSGSDSEYAAVDVDAPLTRTGAAASADADAKAAAVAVTAPTKTPHVVSGRSTARRQDSASLFTMKGVNVYDVVGLHVEHGLAGRPGPGVLLAAATLRNSVSGETEDVRMRMERAGFRVLESEQVPVAHLALSPAAVSGGGGAAASDPRTAVVVSYLVTSSQALINAMRVLRPSDDANLTNQRIRRKWLSQKFFRLRGRFAQELATVLPELAPLRLRRGLVLVEWPADAALVGHLTAVKQFRSRTALDEIATDTGASVAIAAAPVTAPAATVPFTVVGGPAGADMVSGAGHRTAATGAAPVALASIASADHAAPVLSAEADARAKRARMHTKEGLSEALEAERGRISQLETELVGMRRLVVALLYGQPLEPELARLLARTQTLVTCVPYWQPAPSHAPLSAAYQPQHQPYCQPQDQQQQQQQQQQAQQQDLQPPPPPPPSSSVWLQSYAHSLPAWPPPRPPPPAPPSLVPPSCLALPPGRVAVGAGALNAYALGPDSAAGVAQTEAQVAAAGGRRPATVDPAAPVPASLRVPIPMPPSVPLPVPDVAALSPTVTPSSLRQGTVMPLISAGTLAHILSPSGLRDTVFPHVPQFDPTQLVRIPPPGPPPLGRRPQDPSMS